MGQMRRAALAAVLILAPQLAGAADLLPPPPPLDAPPLRGTEVSEFSGWYLRGDVGVGASRSGDWKIVPTTPSPGTTLQESIRSTSLTDSAFVDFGVGYAFNSWLRFDVTGEYRGAFSAKGTYFGIENSTFTPCTAVSTAGVCTLYQNQFPGKISTMALMLNAYVDLGTWYGITPYVGAGVGVSSIKMSGFTDSGANGLGTSLLNGIPVGGATNTVLVSPIRDHTSYQFAYALMAGLAYDVTPNLKLEFGYRYINYGTAASGQIDCLCGQTFPGFKIHNIASHDLRVGMRWLLAEPAAPPPEPMMPLVRKY
jgi:opacity protein-like surface antigen